MQLIYVEPFRQKFEFELEHLNLYIKHFSVQFECILVRRTQIIYYPVSTRNGKNALIARNQGHFEPANNYQRYIVLHSGTIEYQENSIWRRSRLDLQRRVFRTMTYTI